VHDGEVIRVELARALKALGVPWSPVPGDRFVVPDREMDDDVFVVSDMTIEVHDLPSGRILGFNGTTEWALDSMASDSVLWLPREEQLRTLLGERFHSLLREGDTWTVVVSRDGERQSFTDPDVESAYALAVLSTRR
jgi:hypothetical protein